MNEPHSSIHADALEKLAAEAMQTQTIPTDSGPQILERLHIYDEYFRSLPEPCIVPAIFYRDADSKVKAVPIGNSIRVGRRADCEVSLRNATNLSKEHFKVSLEDGLFVVHDMKSRNGTFINGGNTSIDEHVLSDGDIISAGSLIFVFSYGSGNL